MATGRIAPHPQTGKSKAELRKEYPTVAFLMASFIYNPCTGVLIWRPRNGTTHPDIRHNRSFAGNPAGFIRKTNGYVYVGLHRKEYSAHRICWMLWYGFNPDQEIDHINRIRSDNRASNLRLVSYQKQAMNKGMLLVNTSGFIGVSFHKRVGKWSASIASGNGKRKHLGYFEKAEDASAAYQKALEEKWMS